MSSVPADIEMVGVCQLQVAKILLLVTASLQSP